MGSGRAGRHVAVSHRRRRRHYDVRYRRNPIGGVAGTEAQTRNSAMRLIIGFAICGFITLIIGIILLPNASTLGGVGFTVGGGAFLTMALCAYIAVRNRPVNHTVTTTATAVSSTTVSGTVADVSPDYSTTQSAFATAPTTQTMQSEHGGFAPYPDTTETNNFSYSAPYYPPPPPAESHPSGAPPAYSDVVK